MNAQLAAPVTRAQLLAQLQGALESSPHVYAAWLEGADATGQIDEYSDIDLWLDVADGEADALLDLIRQTLAALGTVDIDYERSHPHPQIRQVFLHVAEASPYLLLDLCLQAHSRDRRATSFIAGQDAVTVLFDKANVVRFVTAKPWEDPLAELASLRQEFAIFQRWVDKCRLRGDFLEALTAYQQYTLAPLVTALRLRHAPHKADYHLKHSRRDLPAAAVARLERLYQIAALADIAAKQPRAVAWFEQLVEEISNQHASH